MLSKKIIELVEGMLNQVMKMRIVRPSGCAIPNFGSIIRLTFIRTNSDTSEQKLYFQSLSSYLFEIPWLFHIYIYILVHFIGCNSSYACTRNGCSRFLLKTRRRRNLHSQISSW